MAISTPLYFIVENLRESFKKKLMEFSILGWTPHLRSWVEILFQKYFRRKYFWQNFLGRNIVLERDFTPLIWSWGGGGQMMDKLKVLTGNIFKKIFLAKIFLAKIFLVTVKIFLEKIFWVKIFLVKIFLALPLLSLAQHTTITSSHHPHQWFLKMSVTDGRRTNLRTGRTHVLSLLLYIYSWAALPCFGRVGKNWVTPVLINFLPIHAVSFGNFL